MELAITADRNDAGGIDWTITGDQGFYWWLLNAAGGARDGKLDVGAAASDGTHDRLLLKPLLGEDLKRRSPVDPSIVRAPARRAPRVDLARLPHGGKAIDKLTRDEARARLKALEDRVAAAT